MVDNKERIALNLIKEAHRYNGLFKDSEQKSYGIWLQLMFENAKDQQSFNAYIHDNNMCKCMKLGDKGTYSSYLMI